MSLRTGSLLALGAALVAVGLETLAQAQPSGHAAEPRAYTRPPEIVIVIKVDRIMGRVDVTTTIPVEESPLGPSPRYNAPATRSRDEGAAPRLSDAARVRHSLSR